MRDVLILTGNAGVGKSTVASAWALARHGAAVSGDEIRICMKVREVRRAEGYQEPLVARIAVAAAREFLGAGLHVAVENLWTPRGLEILRDGLAGVGRVATVKLWCAPAENRRRDTTRTGPRFMGPRIDELSERLDAEVWPSDVVTIDSTSMSEAETLAAVDHLFA